MNRNSFILAVVFFGFASESNSGWWSKLFASNKLSNQFDMRKATNLIDMRDSRDCITAVRDSTYDGVPIDYCRHTNFCDQLWGQEVSLHEMSVILFNSRGDYERRRGADSYKCTYYVQSTFVKCMRQNPDFRNAFNQAAKDSVYEGALDE